MKSNQVPDPFWEKYDLIDSGFYSTGPERKVSVGESCRFCGKSKADTTFLNVSHAIPECLGNRQLIAQDECDECNDLFSRTIEDHLDKFTKPFRIIGQIKGKRKVPHYRSNDQKNTIKFTDRMEISFREAGTFVKVDEEKKEIRVMVNREPYIPHLAYKALIKIALSTLDSANDFEPFKSVARWLLDSSAPNIMRPAMLFQTFIPGPRPTNGVASIFLRRKPSVDDVPYAIFIVAFGNVSLQILVPCEVDQGRTISSSIPFFPTPFEFIEWPYGPVTRVPIDMTSDQVLKQEPLPLTYSFDSMSEIDPE